MRHFVIRINRKEGGLGAQNAFWGYEVMIKKFKSLY